MKQIFVYFLGCYLLIASCTDRVEKKISQITPSIDSSATYGYDRNFIKKYASLIELQKGNSKLLIVPQYQGRVMTSSCQC